MERQNCSEAKRAWVLWQLLQELNALLWDRYEKNFLEILIEEDSAPTEYRLLFT
jgi:hypothetical protein